MSYNIFNDFIVLEHGIIARGQRIFTCKYMDQDAKVSNNNNNNKTVDKGVTEQYSRLDLSL